MALGRCLYFRICAHLKCLATFGRGDLPAPPVIRGKNAMVSRLCRVPNYADLVVGRWKFLR
jgi:hypothetical protein